MRTPGLLLMIAAVPAAAAWLYLIGQSAASIVSLLDEPAVADNEEPVVASATADNAPAATAAADESPSARYVPESAAPPAADVASAPTPLAPHLPPAVYADDSSVAPIEHPEITDPRVRALLQPAWDD